MAQTNTCNFDIPLVAYQANYQDVMLPIPASLLVSSIPLDILSDVSTCETFWEWATRNMTAYGVAVLDMPARMLTTVLDAAYGRQWRFQFKVNVPAMYSEDTSQLLAVFAYGPALLAKPGSLRYRQYTQRDMRHPCEFDAVLVRQIVLGFSERGAVVVDPFCGTGTVPRIARETGRSGVGIDIRCPYTNEAPACGF